MKQLVENTQKYYLISSIQDIATKNDTFYLQDGFFISEDDSIFIKETEDTTKLFQNEKR